MSAVVLSSDVGCRRVVADRQVSAIVKSVNVVCNCNVLRPSGESGGDPDLPPVGDGEESTIRRKSLTETVRTARC
jgi:hypothetical protein